MHGATGFLALLGLNSFLAFFVNLSNFLVTKHTSALTLQARPVCPDSPEDWTTLQNCTAGVPSTYLRMCVQNNVKPALFVPRKAHACLDLAGISHPCVW